MSVDARNRLQPSLFDRLIDDQRSIGSSRSVARSGARSDTLAMRATEADARSVREIAQAADPSRTDRAATACRSALRPMPSPRREVSSRCAGSTVCPR
jgi:hypothetical protein